MVSVLITSILFFLLVDANVTGSTEFGPGVGSVLVDSVVCSGNEVRLLDCSIGSMGTTNCTHANDAGVRCSVECMTTTL